MKKILTTIICARLTTAACAATIPQKVVGTPATINGKAVPAALRSNSDLPEVRTLMLTRAGAAKATTKFTIDESKKQYVYALFAVPTDCREEGSYAPTSAVGDTSFIFDLPSGKYDFMAIVDCDAADERVILIKEDIGVSEGMDDIVFDVAEATHSTRISHTDSEGTVLKLPSYSEPSNCTTGDFIDMVTHNGYLCWAGETLAYMECDYILSSNVPSSCFSFLRLDMIGAEQEMVSYVIPVDFTAEVCGPTSSEGWQVAEQTYASTPFTMAYDKAFPRDAGSGYTFSNRGILQGDEWWGTTGIGVFDMKCNSARVAMWQPADYDGVFNASIFPSANVFSGDDSSFQGLPLVRGENGLEQIGLNFGAGTKVLFLVANADSQSIARQNSRFACAPADALKGNCTPLLSACNHYSKLSYTYKGRYGEDMNIDAYDLLTSMDDESIVEQLGGQPCDVKIYVDDKVICNSIHDLPWDVDWQSDKMHKAVITMDNVLINGSIKGCNTAIVNWNPDKGIGFAPTFTSLQFRDTEDIVNDRFEKSADGVIEFTVADLKLEYNEAAEYTYYSISEVKSVRAEYAPHGSEDFSPIEVTEIPEMIFAPGYGYFFRGSLASVDRMSADGWFDLRLYADNADGASIEQVISPAFHVSGLSGVGRLNADGGIVYRVEGRNVILNDGFRVYSIAGTECSGKNMTPGIYIVTDGTRSDKVIIR